MHELHKRGVYVPMLFSITRLNALIHIYEMCVLRLYDMLRTVPLTSWL